MTVECPICGEEMRKSGPGEWLCPSCMNQAYLDDEGEVYYEHDGSDHYESIYDGCVDEY